MNFDCIVIGGGAAGMTAAITASKNGLSTCILEHMDRLGKKILQTGNGKCNLTNTKLSKECYLCDDKEFVMSVINQFDVEHTIDFFQSIGIFPKSKNGYIYPNSEQASAVLEVLKLELEHQGVTICTETEIRKIEKQNGLFHINTANKKFICRYLIIAAGSKAAPKSGSDGSGYELAKAFGHSIIKPLPALVQLKSNLKFCKIMSGVRSVGKVVLKVDDKIVAFDTGEIQYTDYGISGIPIFQISRFAVRAVDAGYKTEVHIDMLPMVNKEELMEMIEVRLQNDGYKTFEQYFIGLLNKKLSIAVIKRAKINPDDIVAEIMIKNPLALEKIVSMIKCFVVPIDGFHTFESGQICSGGVSTAEISGKTMESKLVKNLYFAGEIVDVDGICGGYNLQWAWSSGFVAANSAANSARK